MVNIRRTRQAARMESRSNFVGRAPATAPPIDVLLLRRGRFLSFLKRSRRHDPDLEDVLQDAFVKSLEHQGSLRDANKVVPWFYRVLRNELVDRHRRTARHRRALESLRGAPVDPFASPLPSVSARGVAELMSQLPPRHRETLEALCATDGNVSELALRTGITENHAAVRACRARKALRQLRESDSFVQMA